MFSVDQTLHNDTEAHTVCLCLFRFTAEKSCSHHTRVKLTVSVSSVTISQLVYIIIPFLAKICYLKKCIYLFS